VRLQQQNSRTNTAAVSVPFQLPPAEACDCASLMPSQGHATALGLHSCGWNRCNRDDRHDKQTDSCLLESVSLNGVTLNPLSIVDWVQQECCLEGRKGLATCPASAVTRGTAAEVEGGQLATTAVAGYHTA
jgi:hypothetical protein